MVSSFPRCHDPRVHPARALLVTLLVVATGCSLSSEGTGDPGSFGVPPTEDAATSDVAPPITDSAVPIDDTGSSDTSIVEDSGVADAIDDTLAPDTGTPDTGTPDTGMPDTGTPDTGPPDTGTPDAGPDATPVGVLVGSSTASVTETVSLTGLGTLDWAHWGLTSSGSFNHKKGASLITKGTTGGGPARWDDYPVRFSWSDGDPTASVVDTRTGIYHDKKDEHFTFEAAASETTDRTLTVWLTWNGATGTVNAKLSDASAPEWNGPLPPPGGSGSGVRPAVYIFKYRTVKAGEKLVVKVTQTSAGGYVSLLAAALK